MIKIYKRHYGKITRINRIIAHKERPKVYVTKRCLGCFERKGYNIFNKLKETVNPKENVKSEANKKSSYCVLQR